jgi:dipeptidyl aminopeptidase/acylaminoacyl peptidase
MRMLWTTVAVAGIAAATWTTGVALAGKPAGGGGATPGGTICVQDLGSEVTDAIGARTWVNIAMDGSGANRSSLARTGDARASRMLHGGRRWFIAPEVVAGEDGPGTATKRYDLFAVRDDGGIRVRLTSDPTMEYGWRLDWAPDENATGSTISVIARRWTGTSSTDTVVPGSWGLYSAHLTFDGAGDVAGLAAEPSFALFLGTSNAGSSADVDAFSWSPDMRRLVVSSFASSTSPPRLRVVDAASGVSAEIGEGERPDWSPDGSKIAYSRYIPGTRSESAIESISPDGTSRATLVSVRTRVSATTSQSVNFPRWSPDGAYVAYVSTSEVNGASWTRSIYRVSRSGSGNVNLTPEVTAVQSGFAGYSLHDWR